MLKRYALWILRREINQIELERLRLAHILHKATIEEPAHPHTVGMYDGLNKAMRYLEED